MKTDLAIRLVQKWSFDYIKMDCAGEKCYGVLAVRIITCFLSQTLSCHLTGPPHLLCPSIVSSHS